MWTILAVCVPECSPSATREEAELGLPVLLWICKLLKRSFAALSVTLARGFSWVCPRVVTLVFPWLLCRVILDTPGRVQIRNPAQKELGTYGCLVVNDSGFDMETSLLLRAGKTVVFHTTRLLHTHTPLYTHIDYICVYKYSHKHPCPLQCEIVSFIETLPDLIGSSKSALLL